MSPLVIMYDTQKVFVLYTFIEICIADDQLLLLVQSYFIYTYIQLVYVQHVSWEGNFSLT